MKEKVRFLGLDVHAETITVAVAEPDGEVRSLGTIANREESIRKLIRKLGSAEQLRACYEAGPTAMCSIAADAVRSRVRGRRSNTSSNQGWRQGETDRRDALKLARSHRSGDLTAVWVPDPDSEALRDVVRAREAAKRDQLRARHRLSKFLLRMGGVRQAGLKAWTEPYMAWVRQVRFERPAQQATLLDYLHEVDHMAARVKRLEQAITEVVKLASHEVQEVVKGLQALRGIAEISAVTIVAELGQIARFDTPRQLMGYSGAVPSEDSSGNEGDKAASPRPATHI